MLTVYQHPYLFLHEAQDIYIINPDYCMAYSLRVFNKAITTTFLILIICFFQNTGLAADGQATFKTYCASCHKPDADYTGPALKGAREREAAAGLSKDWVYKWVPNTTSMVQTDPYAKTLFAKYGSVMTPFPSLKKEEIDAVLDWADTYTPPAPPGGGTSPAGATSGGEDNSLLYGLLTLILGVVALILLQVNSNLKKIK